MIISRFYNYLTLSRTSTVLGSYFSNYEKGQSTSLQNKIVQAKTIADLTHIFKEYKNDISPQLYSFATKSLSKLVLESGETLQFKEVHDLLKGYEQLDISIFNKRDITNIFSILRGLKRKKFQIGLFNDFKAKLVEKYIEKVNQKSGPQDLQDMLNAYFELSCLKSHYACKFLASKILIFLQKEKKNGKFGLTESQLNFLMFALSTRQELNKQQCKIRSILLDEIGKDVNVIKIQILVRLSSCLNKMDIFDFDNHDLSVLRMITKRIIENITEFDEHSIFQLISGEYVNRFSGFTKIYEEILKNILVEINDNGQPNLNPDIILKVFQHLSNKFNLNKLQQQDQQKFIKFLDNYTKLSKKDEAKYKLNGKLQTLIHHDFFLKNQKHLILEILKKHDIQPTIKLLYEMVVKNYNIVQFAEFIKTLNISELGDNYRYKCLIILHRLKKQNYDVTNQLEPLLALLKQKFATPETFIEFYQNIKNDKSQINIYRLNQALEGLAAHLPNPFETKSQDLRYRYYYLDYKSNSMTNFDFSNFLQTNDSNINNQQVLKMVTEHIYQSGKELQSNKCLIYLVNKRVNILIDSKDKKCIQIVLNFLSKYNKLVVYQALDSQSEHQLFQIIRKIMAKISIIIQTEQIIPFANVLEKYLTRRFKNYDVEHNYRSLLFLLMKNINIFAGKHTLGKAIISESLRLNILSAKVLQNIDMTKISLPYFDKLKIGYIKDPQVCEPISNITFNSLKILLNNPNYTQFVSKNQGKIIELIEKYNPFELFSYAVYYNQIKTFPSSIRILKQILKNILEKINSFQNIDVIGFFNNALNNNFYNFTLCKKITEKIVNAMSQRINQYSIETHCELVRFIVTQGLNCNEYYQKLVEHFEKTDQYSRQTRDELFFRMAHSTYPFKDEDLKIVQNLLKKNVSQALFYFLMLEIKMTPQYRSQIASKISTEMSKLIGSQLKSESATSQDHRQISYNKIHLQYLKLAYPEQTKTLQIPEQNLHSYSFSVKPKSTEIFEQIGKVTQNECKVITQFGKQNFVFGINRFIIIFLNPKRIGAYYQHQFLKRAIPLLMNEPVEVICHNATNNQLAMLEYFNKCTKNFLSADQLSKLNDFTVQRKRKFKADKIETEVIPEE